MPTELIAPDFIFIYTDGACSGNPGPGGWGAIVVDAKGEVKELGGGEDETTNNRMEMMAVLKALQSLRSVENLEEKQIKVFTDSTYVIRGITMWVWGWKKRGWKTAEGQEVQNRDIWEDLMRAMPGKKVEWNYVRGHKGNPGNERCDRIAVAFSQHQRPGLFRGNLKDYNVNVLDFPEHEDLPDMKPKGEKKPPAHSYLSMVNGVTIRHRNWPECEKRVKGRPGAKFKKAQNAEDENEILSGWGVSPSSVKEE